MYAARLVGLFVLLTLGSATAAFGQQGPPPGVDDFQYTIGLGTPLTGVVDLSIKACAAGPGTTYEFLIIPLPGQGQGVVGYRSSGDVPVAQFGVKLLDKTRVPLSSGAKYYTAWTMFRNGKKIKTNASTGVFTAP